MHIHRYLSAALIAALGLTLIPGSPARAQQNQNWFVPGQGGGASHSGPRAHAPARGPRANPAPDLAPPADSVDSGQPAEAAEPSEPTNPNEPRRQVALPPMPTLPPLAKGNPPPTPVIGVLGVPDVMRASIAAQQVEKAIGERRAKFQADAQKEQATWREMQQSFADQRSKLTPDQIRARERDLQQRITTAQRTFRDRDRIIQDAARFGLAQIEQTMVAVIRQVAESRGMNLVLHRAQVALNVNEYDITNEVTAQLN